MSYYYRSSRYPTACLALRHHLVTFHALFETNACKVNVVVAVGSENMLEPSDAD